MATYYDDYDDNEFDPSLGMDWYAQVNLGIDETRMLYSHICYALETWPGAPRRPVEEQEYLKYLKGKLFAMILDYQFSEGQ
jgi:hypothetical protein|tara:strand:+ start:413 stop:655 length:243 start_codon:yes stop_codon:yes gene_type:complete